MEARTLLSLQRLLMLSLLCIAAWMLQKSFLLNSDVSFLIHCASLLAQGGSYGKDFLETNPPLILYLYRPCLWLIQYASLDVGLALRLYVLMLGLFSFSLCQFLLKDIFKASYQQSLCALLLPLIFFILPLGELGQRENLAVILITPYLLLGAARLGGHPSYRSGLLVLIGWMAGLGFSLKPFFFATYVLIEVYALIQDRKSWGRLEHLSLIATVCFYALFLMIKRQDYLSVILPLIKHNYFSWYTVTWVSRLHFPSAIYFYFLCGFYGLACFYQDQKPLIHILFLSTVGFWLSFMYQGTDWYYHELPEFSYGILLQALLFVGIIEKPFKRLFQYKILFLYLCISATYVYTAQGYFFKGADFPLYPFGFFGLLSFTALLLQMAAYSQFRLKYIIQLVCVIALATSVYFILHDSMLHAYDAKMSLLIFALLYMLILPHERFVQLCHWIFGFILGLVIFIYPAYRVSFVASYTSAYHEHYQQLIAEMKPYQHHSTYYFTNMSEIIFPLVDETKQDYVSRFWSLIWLPKLANPRDFSAYEAFYQVHERSFDYYLQAIMKDFEKSEPDFVFVDDRVHSQHIYYGAIAPDYLQLFYGNREFITLWQHYEYIKTIDNPPFWRLKVYQRLA